MTTDISILLNQFKHRAVRDLAWVIASPPLVTGKIDDVKWWSDSDCSAEFNDCLIALQQLDVNPKPLLSHLDELKNSRLGSIFEGFISYWLKISPNYRELLQNIQLIEDKVTYGEIDFIIQEVATGKVIHLEVAVKFYLGSHPFEDAYRWFGTNVRDQLGKKIDHLKTHQTQLTKKFPKQVKHHCPKTIDEKHCFIKGRLFYPQNITQPPKNIFIGANHLIGEWKYVTNKENNNNLIHITKSHWLANLSHQDIEMLLNYPQKKIGNIDRAECFVQFENIKGVLIEKQRVFLLPETFTFPIQA